MKKLGILILINLLVACAYFPPKPAECSGAFKPVNASAENALLSDKSSFNKALITGKHVVCNKEVPHG